MLHVVDIGEIRNEYKILFGKPQGRSYHLSDLGVGGRVIYR